MRDMHEDLPDQCFGVADTAGGHSVHGCSPALMLCTSMWCRGLTLCASLHFVGLPEVCAMVSQRTCVRIRGYMKGLTPCMRRTGHVNLSRKRERLVAVL